LRTKFFRTKYLTGSHIQLKYLSLLMLSMVVPLVVVGMCLYYLMFTVTAEQIGIPEYIAYNLFPVIKKINFILLMGVPPLFLVLMLWGIILSHRFAGPLERLEKELHKIAKEEDYKHRIKLRRHDDMKPIAESINNLLDKIEGRKHEHHRQTGNSK